MNKSKSKFLLIFLVFIAVVLTTSPVSQYLLSYSKDYLTSFKFRNTCENLSGHNFTFENVTALSGFILRDLESGGRGLL